MRIRVFLLTTILIGVLCTSAGANIYTSGLGDACVDYLRATEIVHGTPSSTTTYTLYNQTDTSLDTYYYYNDPGLGGRIQNRQAVFIFPINSLRGTTLPATGVKLYFYTSTPSPSIYFDFYHKDLDLGPNVTVNHHSYKGSSSDVTTLVGVLGPGWISIDVTSQIQQDLGRGFSYSTFMISHNGYNYDYYIGASEGGNGAYLAIPEPGSIVGLLCGLGGLAGFAWRRRK